jgi:internalin A
LAGNQITDISPLSGLTNLQELGLGENQITDISPHFRAGTAVASPTSSPLSGLTNLQVAWPWWKPDHRHHSHFQGLQTCSGFGLGETRSPTSLHFQGLQTCRCLGLVGNQITDITPLSGLTNLQGLYLGGNQITDISPTFRAYKPAVA